MARKNHSGGGNRKKGRNLASCASYKARHTREKNKVKKITKHLKKHPLDLESKKVLDQLKAFLK